MSGMSKEYAEQQFHNLHHFKDDDYVRPEWYEMPQFAQHFARGGVANAPERVISSVKNPPRP